MLVGITGFEPATSSSRTKRATKLRHIPVVSRTVVRGTRNIIPLGSGLDKTAGCVRFAAGVEWPACWRGVKVAAVRRRGLDPPLQKAISSFAASFLQKPRSRPGKIGKRRYRLLGSSCDLRQSRRADGADGADEQAKQRSGRRTDGPTTPQPTTPQPVYPRSTTRISDADGGQNRRTGAYLDWPSPLDTSIHMRP